MRVVYSEGALLNAISLTRTEARTAFGNDTLYMEKYLTGLVYFLTGGLFMIGVLYDYWTLNEQVSEANLGRPHHSFQRILQLQQQHLSGHNLISPGIHILRGKTCIRTRGNHNAVLRSV